MISFRSSSPAFPPHRSHRRVVSLTMPKPLDCKSNHYPFSFLPTQSTLSSSTECFGIHSGDPQSANLGDGNGAVDQLIELREDFGDPNLGTCLESLNGGNHFRVFTQNGAQHNTGALFLAYVLSHSLLELSSSNGAKIQVYPKKKMQQTVILSLRMDTMLDVTISFRWLLAPRALEG